MAPFRFKAATEPIGEKGEKMPEAQTETTTETTEKAPPPVAEKAPVDTGAAAKPAAETTGENKPDPKEVARQAFKSRDERREKKASERLAELEKELASLRAAKAPEREAEPKSFLDDPDGSLKRMKDEAKREAIEEFKNLQAKAISDYEFNQSAEKAANWLLTRSHLKEDAKLTGEVSQIIKDKYARVADADPAAAARLAYIDVCAAKGIQPDLDGFKPGSLNETGGKAGSGVRPNPVAAGKRVFKRGEGERYINEAKPGSKDYSARIREVEEAEREGRIV